MPTGRRLRTVEVARRLELTVEQVYDLIFTGELLGGPAEDGLVYVTEADLEAYRQRLGADSRS